MRPRIGPGKPGLLIKSGLGVLVAKRGAAFLMACPKARFRILRAAAPRPGRLALTARGPDLGNQQVTP